MGLLFIEKVPANVRSAFEKEVIAISKRQKISNPNDLMITMNSETAGTFSPSIQNKSSGATGLIQFMPKTAIELGTSVAALAKMTHLEQLVYVEKYISMHRGYLRDGRKLPEKPPLVDLDDVYLLIFYPAAVGKPASHVIAKAGQAVYTQNRGVDVNKDGNLTVDDFAKFARRLVPKTYIPQYITKTVKKNLKLFFYLSTGALILGGIFYYFLTKTKK
jgi:hypothetical protein